MSKPDFEQFLNDSLNQPKQDIGPDKNLWPGIERAIAQGNQSNKLISHHGWNKLAAVAACCIAALLSVQFLLAKVSQIA